VISMLRFPDSGRIVPRLCDSSAMIFEASDPASFQELCDLERCCPRSERSEYGERRNVHNRCDARDSVEMRFERKCR